jgi:hypothetical protein
MWYKDFFVFVIFMVVDKTISGKVAQLYERVLWGIGFLSAFLGGAEIGFL